ncbi:unnamed protein product [Mytilus coruscus]|uniref:Transposase domain-containing protein n=1 Tax=Mytilus coruscus TaxID=42192 RepID=A0A6J8A0S7_MYTCO|nr:unnamed protein product [Mytilus coruscus]
MVAYLSVPCCSTCIYKVCILEDDFVKYVVCSKCNEPYTLSEAEECRTCTFIKYPNHAQRKLCGEKLLKEVVLQDGSKRHYPIKLYCYRSVMKTLQNLLDRPGFKQRCEDWRQRTSIPGTLRDIYDGRVWKSFMTHAGRPFLEMPKRYALQLNVDWFQPYKHSPYSSRGIYLSLMNLPRSERLKKENVITAGVIPGPDEHSLSINTYLRPLVDELNDLWKNGFKYKARDDDKTEEYYVALICCSCDVPATRKIGGFLGHTAKAGCSKRTTKNHEHRSIAEEIRQQDNMTAKQKLESKHGVRYTELLRLPYFNAISSFVVDPMHNLFQGTAKYMFKTIWKDKLTGQDLQEIQDMVDNVTVPASFGRILSSFTSEQWKNWTLHFSPIALKGHLPKKDFDCWLLFVEACRLLCVSSITIQDLRKGHEKIVEFCRTFESIYGSAMVTPNMHLHIHLVDCI